MLLSKIDREYFVLMFSLYFLIGLAVALFANIFLHPMISMFSANTILSIFSTWLSSNTVVSIHLAWKEARLFSLCQKCQIEYPGIRILEDSI